MLRPRGDGLPLFGAALAGADVLVGAGVLSGTVVVAGRGVAEVLVSNFADAVGAGGLAVAGTCVLTAAAGSLVVGSAEGAALVEATAGAG